MPSEALDERLYAELEELVSMEVRDILATATQEGFSPRDVVSALELALHAEIAALAGNGEVETDISESEP